MIDQIHRYEMSKPKQHAVWMSYQQDSLAGRGSNRNLFESPAEIISPNAPEFSTPISFSPNASTAAGSGAVAVVIRMVLFSTSGSEEQASNLCAVD